MQSRAALRLANSVDYPKTMFSRQRNNRDVLQDYRVWLDSSEFLRLHGSPNSPAFLFIHGFGSSALDLLPLAASFHSRGYTCELVRLRGHTSDFSELPDAKMSHWLSQIREGYDRLKEYPSI